MLSCIGITYHKSYDIFSPLNVDLYMFLSFINILSLISSVFVFERINFVIC